MSRRAGEGRSATLRWAVAAAVALGLHAAVGALLIGRVAPDPLDVGGGDAIAVELEPIEGEAAKPDEAEPAAQADEATTASAPAAAAAASQAAPERQTSAPPTPSADPVPEALPPPPPTEPPPQEPPPAHPPPAEPPAPSVEAPPQVALQPPAAAAAASEHVPAVAPPPLPPAVEAPRAPPQPETRPAPASQASAASAEAEDAAPVVQRLSAAREAAWRGKLVPHLNRYRRFPPGLRSGTARVGFTLDDAGRVTAASVVASSGDPALDAAARDLVERASPFPTPPAGTGGTALSFVVPIHYDARRP